MSGREVSGRGMSGSKTSWNQNLQNTKEIRDCSGAECPIDLKPGCKFKFVLCLETYLKKLISLGHEGTLPGPFLPRVLRN